MTVIDDAANVIAAARLQAPRSTDPARSAAVALAERELLALVPDGHRPRVKSPVRLPVTVRHTPSGAVEIDVACVLSQVLDQLADAYDQDPDRVGQLLEDLAIERGRREETRGAVARDARADWALDHADAAVDTARDRLVNAAIDSNPTVRLTGLQAEALADQLDANAQPYRGWGGAA